MLLAFQLVIISLLQFYANLIYANEAVPYDFTWLDSEKKIFVIQNKIHEKEFSFYLDLAAGDHSHSNFQNAIIFQGRAGLFVTEKLGIELFYSLINNRNNEAVSALQNIRETNGSDRNMINPFIRKIDKYFGMAVVYSPFYAKVAAWDRTYYFDLNVALGLVKITGSSNMKHFMEIPPNPLNRFETESYLGPYFRTELRFYVTRRFTISPVFSQSWFTAELPQLNRPEGTLSFSEIMISFGVNL